MENNLYDYRIIKTMKIGKIKIYRIQFPNKEIADYMDAKCEEPTCYNLIRIKVVITKMNGKNVIGEVADQNIKNILKLPFCQIHALEWEKLLNEKAKDKEFIDTFEKKLKKSLDGMNEDDRKRTPNQDKV